MTAQTTDLNPSFVAPDDPIPGQTTVEEQIAVAGVPDPTIGVATVVTTVSPPPPIAAPVLSVVTPTAQSTTSAAATTAGTTPSPASSSPASPPLVTDVFEGVRVEGATFLISGRVDVETFDEEIASPDDRVRLVGEYKCIGINFKLNPKTGDFIRVQVLKPMRLELCPWDPSDPNDTGIFRKQP